MLTGKPHHTPTSLQHSLFLKLLLKHDRLLILSYIYPSVLLYTLLAIR